MVRFDYSIPGTEILAGPAAAINTTFTQFQVRSTEPDSRFECRLDGVSFTACDVPVVLTGLGQGPHTFAVRASNSLDNFDTTPASWNFSVDSIAPLTTIESGPTGPTAIRRPEFRFSSGEAGVEFSCRFDGGEFGPCAEPGVEIPAEALSYGPHTLSVRASDPTGNTGPAATRTFEVIEREDPALIPPLRATPTLKLGRVKLDRKRGRALLPAKVSAAGRIVLAKSARVKRRAKRVAGPATVRLKVVARGKARKTLRRKRKLTIRVRVLYVPREGGSISRKKKVKLKLSPKKGADPRRSRTR